MGDAPRQDGAQTRVLLDFQGRKLRGRMKELGLTIGDLAERTGIDRVRLVAVLFGQEEMGGIEWRRLREPCGLTGGIDMTPKAALNGLPLGPDQPSFDRSNEPDGDYQRPPRRSTRRRRVRDRERSVAYHDRDEGSWLGRGC